MQTLLAVTEATKEMFPLHGNVNVDYRKFLVLSLGTGSSKSDSGVEVGQGVGWGLFDWFGRQILIDVFFGAMDDMVHIYLSTFFRGSHSSNNYLRIQVHTRTNNKQLNTRLVPVKLNYIVDFITA